MIRCSFNIQTQNIMMDHFELKQWRIIEFN